MATIEKRTGKKGEISYRVKIRMLGHEHQTGTFDRLTDAKRWVQDTESAIRDGRHFKTVEAKKHTLADAIDRYVHDILPQKPKNAANTNAQLMWWKEQLGFKTLADVTPALIGEKRDKLLNDPIVFTASTRRRSPATVVRYLAALSPVFTVAVKEWAWMDSSPMVKVNKPKESQGRVRFLSDSEREALLKACKQSQNAYLCQSALKIDPPSASKIDPPQVVVSVIDPRFYSPTIIPGFYYFTVMRNPIQKSCCHFVVPEYLRPFPEG